MDYPIGVDVSYYEVMWGLPLLGQYWKPEKSVNPISFVIQRSSYGMFKDKCFDFLYEKSVSQIPIIGFYHYFSSAVNYQKQITTMLDAISGKKYQFLAVDYEGYGNVLDNRTFAEFCEMMKQLKKITGKRVLAYFNPSIYQSYMQPFGADKVIKTWDIWLAQYPYMTDWSKYKFPETFKGAKVTFHQAGGGDIPKSIGNISGKAYGSWRNGIDLDVFNGTKEQLEAWAGVEVSVPVDPPPVVVTPPPTLPETYRVATLLEDNVNVRNSPWGAIVSTSLKKGSKVKIFSTMQDPKMTGNLWGQIDVNQWICINWQGKSWIVYDDSAQSLLGLYRVKKDSELPESQRPPRARGYVPGKPNSLRGLPQTQKAKGGKGTVNLTTPWQNLIKAINTPIAYKYVIRPDSGFVNKPDWPCVVQLLFGGDIVDVYKADGNKRYVKIYHVNETPPDPKTMPNTMKHQFSVIYTDGHSAMGTDTQAGMCYTILIGNPGEELWFDASQLVKI